MQVLWVEDDPVFGRAVQLALRSANYQCEWVRDGETALLALDTQPFDLVLFDLGDELRPGLRILQHIRSSGHQLPILIVSARQIVDVSSTPSTASDGHISPTIGIPDILARTRAAVGIGLHSEKPCLGNGVLSLDPRSRRAVYLKTEANLTSREFLLLRTLMSRPGAVFSREEIEDRIYSWEETIQGNAVEFLIHGVRKKLGAGCIKNVRGAGWMVDRAD